MQIEDVLGQQEVRSGVRMKWSKTQEQKDHLYSVSHH
jgi:hypothetical protein